MKEIRAIINVLRKSGCPLHLAQAWTRPIVAFLGEQQQWQDQDLRALGVAVGLLNPAPAEQSAEEADHTT